MAATHGKLLVETAVCIIEGARDGVTWSELEDIISLHNEVMYEVLGEAKALPATWRMPQEKWQALVTDLRSLVEETSEFGCDGLLQWFVPDYGDVIAGEYLSDLNVFVLTHTLMAEYFTGKWAHEPKPYVLPPRLASKFFADAKGASFRDAPEQPLRYTPISQKGVVKDGIRFNVRKLREAAFHLSAACSWAELEDHCLSNYSFLRDKILATQDVNDVMDDFQAVPQDIAQSVNGIRTALGEAKDIILADPFQLMSQLAGRLLPRQRANPVVRGILAKLLESGRLEGKIHDVALMPKHACIPSTANASISKLRAHKHACHALTASRRLPVYASGSDDKSIKVWQLGRAEPIQVVDDIDDWMRCLVLNKDASKLVGATRESSLSVFDVSTGKLVLILEGHSGKITDVALNSDASMAASVAADGYGFVWDLIHKKNVSQFHGHDGEIRSVAFCDDKRVVTCGIKDGLTRIWDVQTGELLNTLYGSDQGCSTCTPTINGTHIITGSNDGIVRVYSMPGRISGDVRTADVSLPGHTKTVTCVDHVGPGSALILSSSEDGSIRLFNFIKKECVAAFTAGVIVRRVVSLVHDSTAVYSTETGIIGTLSINKMLEMARNSSSFIFPAETEAPEPSYEPAACLVTIKEGKGLTTMNKDENNAETARATYLEERAKRIAELQQAESAKSKRELLKAKIFGLVNDVTVPAPAEAEAPVATKEAMADKKPDKEVDKEEDKEDPLSTREESHLARVGTMEKRQSDLSDAYGFDVELQQVHESGAENQESGQADERTPTPHAAKRLFEEKIKSAHSADSSPGVARRTRPVSGARVRDAMQRLSSLSVVQSDVTGSRQPSRQSTLSKNVSISEANGHDGAALSEHAEAHDDAEGGHDGVEGGHDESEAADSLSVYGFNDHGFDDIADGLTAEEKQAAFERLVFGENADVIGMDNPTAEENSEFEAVTLMRSRSSTNIEAEPKSKTSFRRKVAPAEQPLPRASVQSTASNMTSPAMRRSLRMSAASAPTLAPPSGGSRRPSVGVPMSEIESEASLTLPAKYNTGTHAHAANRSNCSIM